VKRGAKLREAGRTRESLSSPREVLAFSAAAITAGSAGSATSKSSFQVFVHETTSAASNGLMLNSELAGQFNVAAKTASGEGDWSLIGGTTEIDHGVFAHGRGYAVWIR
jgi:hypothetical protein